MAKKYFVLGIGGTGMRCIESLIHLCAMGMFDDTDIYLLALDTDKNNGNFARLKTLKEAYERTKDMNSSGRAAHKNTFFSANIKYYEFSPDYERQSTFRDVFHYNDTKVRNPQETELADLMFTDNVETFNLRHGYRAQTHLGSMMMYHSILEAAESQQNNSLKQFLQELINACQSEHPRVFILGSVFGGTGASSIPIIPQAITRAAAILSSNANIRANAYFGSTLLTAYFSFNAPSDSEKTDQKIIATSDKFALNSKVAMMFYEDDATVKTTYQKFYMLGTPNIDWNPMAKEKDKLTKTITGGEKQTNDSHYIELMAACAALDFFNLDEEQLEECKNAPSDDKLYEYRSINNSGVLEFKDFVGLGREQEFAKKFGMLVVLSLMCNTEIDYVTAIQTNQRNKVQGYSDINVEQIRALKDYFNLFNVKYEVGGSISEGWLRQIARSAGAGNFLFNAELFTPQTMRDMMKYEWNKKLYRDVGVGKDNKYKVGLFGNKIDVFEKDALMPLYKKDKSSELPNRLEALLQLLYQSLCNIYGFKN